MKSIDRPAPELTETRRFPYRPAASYSYEPAAPKVPASHYLWIVLRHKWKIALFVAACLLAVFLVSARLTPVYEAASTLEVDRSVPAGVIGQQAARPATEDDADQFMATQEQLIQSDAVLRSVAQKYSLLEREGQIGNLAPEAARRKSESSVHLKQLRVERPINTYILRISYRSPDPQLAADVANAIAQSYLEHTFDIRVRSSAALSVFMTKQLDELRAKMERSSMALGKFEQELGVINPEQKTNILSARLLQLNTEYTKAQADRANKQAAYSAMKNGSLAAEEVSSQGEALAKLAEQVDLAKQHLAEISTTYGANHPEYRKAASELAEVQRQFVEAQHLVAERIETDYNEALNREQILRDAVLQTKADYDALNARSFEYQQLKRDADADRNVYADLERHIREAGINSGFQNSAIRIADFARPPDKPVFPRTKLYLLLAFIICSVLGICGAIAADALDNTLRDPEQSARLLNTVVIGMLPAVRELKRISKARSDSALVAAPGLVPFADAERNGSGLANELALVPGYDGIAGYAEAIRALRHSIFLPDIDRTLKSLLITSAAPAEGKSTAIVHLAIAHVGQGKRTLIIDADLRRPAMTKKLNLPQAAGLSGVLVGDVAWKNAVLKTSWPDLDVLPSGVASRRASDLIGSMIADILDEAARDYDLILVDAPPLLGFAEAMQCASAVDGVVVLARAGQTNRKAVATVFATLTRLRANIVGLVLNEIEQHGENGYYNHYRTYYAQGAAREK